MGISLPTHCYVSWGKKMRLAIHVGAANMGPRGEGKKQRGNNY